MRALKSGYTAEVDAVGKSAWTRILDEFEDANIYQTWAFGSVMSGDRNISHVVLRRDGRVVAAAQARLARIPLVNAGVAYVRWGPMWQRIGQPSQVEVLAQILRALRNEYCGRRGLVLRVVPMLFEEDSSEYSEILATEGFGLRTAQTKSSTLLLDLSPTLDVLRQGMNPHWKRKLKQAEREGLEIVEGTSDELFGGFVDIYREMVARKHFVETNDINKFRLMQGQLPEKLKMYVMLCRSGTRICAGLIYTGIGRTAVFLFGATSDEGLKSNGSFLLQSRAAARLKQVGIPVYDLNGINRTNNPGTYRFKADFAGVHGREVSFLGHFDSHAGLISSSCVACGDAARTLYRALRAGANAATSSRLWKWQPTRGEHAARHG